ncbi:hypothetical protein ACFZ8E_01600 [Methylobacterium sp. HMF5984]|uniref:hypothetical protein n=1 Tax=Methylobacterium sp. HMF5984 TaxID=3367370 RepID=UPI0038530D34
MLVSNLVPQFRQRYRIANGILGLLDFVVTGRGIRPELDDSHVPVLFRFRLGRPKDFGRPGD